MKTENPIVSVTVAINTQLCNGCGQCITMCLFGVLGMDSITKKAKLVDPFSCNGCAECIDICQQLAIKFINCTTDTPTATN